MHRIGMRARFDTFNSIPCNVLLPSLSPFMMHYAS